LKTIQAFTKGNVAQIYTCWRPSLSAAVKIAQYIISTIVVGGLDQTGQTAADDGHVTVESGMKTCPQRRKS
jgi:hypothetical protein